jgi:hypothetical protein
VQLKEKLMKKLPGSLNPNISYQFNFGAKIQIFQPTFESVLLVMFIPISQINYWMMVLLPGIGLIVMKLLKNTNNYAALLF